VRPLGVGCGDVGLASIWMLVVHIPHAGDLTSDALGRVAILLPGNRSIELHDAPIRAFSMMDRL